MGRGATMAYGNTWYEARIEAAKWNERLSSREGAAGELGLSPDVINSVERGLHKCMPVDVAVIMADGYNAPELLKYYCMHECPIGREMPLSCSVPSIERITIKFLKAFDSENVEKVKEDLIDIAEDGRISDDEANRLEKMLPELREIAKVISELHSATEKAIMRYKKNADKGKN